MSEERTSYLAQGIHNDSILPAWPLPHKSVITTYAVHLNVSVSNRVDAFADIQSLCGQTSIETQQQNGKEYFSVRGICRTVSSENSVVLPRIEFLKEKWQNQDDRSPLYGVLGFFVAVLSKQEA